MEVSSKIPHLTHPSIGNKEDKYLEIHSLKLQFIRVIFYQKLDREMEVVPYLMISLRDKTLKLLTIGQLQSLHKICQIPQNLRACSKSFK